MSATASAATPKRTRPLDPDETVSVFRFLWVGPLTVAAALAVNLTIKMVVLALDPSLERFGQLQAPLVRLTLEGAVAAVLVFAVIAAFVPRPIFWYRIIAVLALLVSLVPDAALGVGGAAATWASRVVGPFLSLGEPSGAAAGAGRPTGGPPALPMEQVAVLMLLHVATFAVCVLLLTTLTRRRSAS